MPGSLPLSLNVYVQWEDLAARLGLPRPGVSLPQRTCCPLCEKHKFHVYEDTIMGGQWHHCSACGSAGDMVQLACRAWKLNPETAAPHLLKHGLPLPPEALSDGVQRGYRLRLEWRNRINDFWAAARQAITRTRSESVVYLKHRFRLTSQIECVPVNEHVGSTSRSAVTALSSEILHFPKSRMRNWSDCLVLPFYNLPGRISGFYFAGRRGRPIEDCFFWPEPVINCNRDLLYRKGAHRKEAGLYGLHTVEKGRYLLDGKVLVVDNPLLAARIQNRHHSSDLEPLPIVAYIDDATCHTHRTWEQLGGEAVIWAPKLTPAAIMQAIITHGSISNAGPMSNSSRAEDHYLALLSARDVCRRIVKKAKPWRDALRAWIDDHDDGDVGELFSALKTYSMFNCEEVFSELKSQELRVREIMKTPEAPKQFKITARGEKGMIVYEFKDGYYVWKQSKRMTERLTDFTIVFDKQYEQKGRLCREGRIVTSFGNAPFEAIRGDSNKPFSVVVTAAVLRAGFPPPYVRPGWERRLQTLAEGFNSAPEM